MFNKNILAFATDIGGKTSHTAIMAKSLNVPAVVGLKDATLKINNQDSLIVDGTEGVVIVNPDNETVCLFKDKQAKAAKDSHRFDGMKGLASKTIDDREVRLMANLELPEEVPGLMNYCPSGIGLYRTEYFYMNRVDIPSEEEQFEAYKNVALESSKIGIEPVITMLAKDVKMAIDFLDAAYKDSIDIKCERSGKAGNCDITNGSRMSKIINDALDVEEYRAVFLMMDLKTKCHQSEQTHTCLLKLIQEYRPKYKVEQKSKFYLFVVCNEIESWFLTIDKKINNTNNVNENHKAKLKKILEVRSEPEIVDKIIEGLNSGKYQLDFSKNKSLQHFIKKLQEFNANL
jgi:phosphoenolpyruvate-protein kinase (PTS system EI component)